MMTSGMYASSTCEWETPQALFDRLDAAYHFECDVCATAMVKPDVDNVAKIILDAMNNLAWHYDKQVASLAVDKLYGEQTGVHVRIVPIGDEA